MHNIYRYDDFQINESFTYQDLIKKIKSVINYKLNYNELISKVNTILEYIKYLPSKKKSLIMASLVSTLLAFNSSEQIFDIAKKIKDLDFIEFLQSEESQESPEYSSEEEEEEEEELDTDSSGEEMTHGDILLRQAFKESRFDPKAVSHKGAKGLTQIMPSALEDYIKNTGKDPKKINLNDPKTSIDIQVYVMKNLYNSNFINIKGKGQTKKVRLAKTLAAYNYGRGNLSKLLNRLKEEGKVDIYKSLDWTKELPKETSDYIDKILLKKDTKFDEQFKEATRSKKNKGILRYYSKIINLDIKSKK